MKDNLPFNRRKFVSVLGMLGIGGIFPVGAKPSTGGISQASEEILKAGPYLQNLQTDKVTIRWITHFPCYSWIEYGFDPLNLDQKAQVIENGMMAANNKVHAIPLTGILPGTTYHYRIVSKVIESFLPYKLTYGDTFTGEVHDFKTPTLQAATTAFLVFNDIHDRPASFGQLMPLASPGKKDFVFLNGDMFDYQTDEDQLVNHLINPLCKLFASTTPFILSRGNHETRGTFSRQLTDYFDGREHPFYYAFESGPAYIIVLDSGEDKPDEEPVYAGIVDFDAYRLRQAAWLREEVQKKAFKKAKYKIVLSHIPLYHSGDWHGTLHCREVWGPILNNAKIDVLISGHTHTYGIHPADKATHHYPIVIGGGPAEGKRTIIEIKADQRSLEVIMIADSGKKAGVLNITPN